MADRGSPRCQAAFEAYCSMGSRRSLAKVHRQLANATPVDPDAPDIDTLKYWSRKYRWVARCEEHDDTVAAAVEEKMVEVQVGERVDAITGADDLIRLCNRLIADAVQDVTGLRPTDPKELRAIGSTLVEAAKLKELLEGRADSRREHRTPEELEAALREVRAKLGYPDADTFPTHH